MNTKTQQVRRIIVALQEAYRKAGLPKEPLELVYEWSISYEDSFSGVRFCESYCFQEGEFTVSFCEINCGEFRPVPYWHTRIVLPIEGILQINCHSFNWSQEGRISEIPGSDTEDKEQKIFAIMQFIQSKVPLPGGKLVENKLKRKRKSARMTGKKQCRKR